MRMSMCEHMHNDVHVTRMYKSEKNVYIGERVVK